jgi:hypothetical protein
MPADGGARARLGEEANHDVARVGGIDHVVDEVARGGAVGERVELPLDEQLLPPRRALLGGQRRQLRAVDTLTPVAGSMKDISAVGQATRRSA